MIEHGQKARVEIATAKLRDYSGGTIVELEVAFSDSTYGKVAIFITPKSAGIARRQLKLCGFDVDKQHLEEIVMDGRLLSGHKINVIGDTYKGKPQLRIDMDSEPTRDELARADELLRAAKSFAEEAEPPDDGDGPPPIADSDQIPF